MRSAARIAAVGLVAAVVILIWPRNLGGRVAYVMVSGHSMEPTMHSGDLAMVRARARYHVGDVVAYRVPQGQTGAGSLVIHRIIGGDARTGFTTRGDHNAYLDPWRPRSADIIGARWALVPGLAETFARLRGPVPLALFAAVLAALSAYTVAGPTRPPARARAVPAGGRAPVT